MPSLAYAPPIYELPYTDLVAELATGAAPLPLGEGVGEACVDGACGPAEWGADEMRCGADCADLMTDDTHCGACDSPCEGGLVCVSGSCEMPLTCDFPVPDECDGACVDLDSDPANCGDCGNQIL